jgi:hypothetical protein
MSGCGPKIAAASLPLRNRFPAGIGGANRYRFESGSLHGTWEATIERALAIIKTPACADAYPSQADAGMPPEPPASATTTSILPIAKSFLDPPHHRPFRRGRDERRSGPKATVVPGITAASAAEGMLTRFAVCEPQSCRRAERWRTDEAKMPPGLWLAQTVSPADFIPRQRRRERAASYGGLAF